MTVGDPQFLKKTLTVQEDELITWFNNHFPVRDKLINTGIDPGLRNWITNHLLSDKRIEAAKTMDNKLHRYDLEINNDTHWALVKLGADHQMHYEQYAEEVLKAHVEQQLLDQQTKD